MSHASHTPGLDTPCRYRISVQGKPELHWARTLHGIECEHRAASGQASVTVLTGKAADQAALLGILNMLYDHQLTLLSVETWYDQDRP